MQDARSNQSTRSGRARCQGRQLTTRLLVAGSLAFSLLFATSVLGVSAQEAPTPPVTTIEPDSAWRNEPAPVVLVASDPDGVAETRYTTDGWATSHTYDGPFLVADEGVTVVDFYSVDALGAREDTRSAEIRLDFTPPTVEPFLADDVVDGELVGLFGVEVTDALSGVAEIFVGIDAGPWLPYEDPMLTTDVVGHTVAFYAVDVAGNASEPDSTTFADLPPDDDDGSSAGEPMIAPGPERDTGSASTSSAGEDSEGFLPYTETEEPFLPYTGANPAILLLAAAALMAGLALRLSLE